MHPQRPTAPTWRVRRRWLPHAAGRGVRARFDAHRRRRQQQRPANASDGGDRWYHYIDDGGCLSGFDTGVEIVLLLGVVLAVLLFVFGGPVLLIGIDLVWFVVVFVAGMIGRFVFGRPWSVEAIADTGERREWKIRGFGDAGRLCEQLTAEFAAGLDPHPDTHPSHGSGTTPIG